MTVWHIRSWSLHDSEVTANTTVEAWELRQTSLTDVFHDVVVRQPSALAAARAMAAAEGGEAGERGGAPGGGGAAGAAAGGGGAAGGGAGPGGGGGAGGSDSELELAPLAAGAVRVPAVLGDDAEGAEAEVDLGEPSSEA
jgi:hypothetical protein